MTDPALRLAMKFHDYYERLAPDFGYETRDETRQFDAESANGRLMVAVCDLILRDLVDKPTTPNEGAAAHDV